MQIQIAVDQIPCLLALLPAAASQNAGFVFDGTNLFVPVAYETQVQAIVSVPGWPASGNTALLRAYASGARYAKEVGGITVSGRPVATDRASQAQIAGALLTVQVNPSVTIQWKYADGSFAPLDATAIVALANAVSAYVQSCFAAEAALLTGINATPPTIATTANVDAALAAVTSSF